VQRGSSSSARGVEVPQVVRKLPAAAATDGSQAMYETVQGKLVVGFVSISWLLWLVCVVIVCVAQQPQVSNIDDVVSGRHAGIGNRTCLNAGHAAESLVAAAMRAHLAASAGMPCQAGTKLQQQTAARPCTRQRQVR
jgi:hypothetical protein